MQSRGLGARTTGCRLNFVVLDHDSFKNNLFREVDVVDLIAISTSFIQQKVLFDCPIFLVSVMPRLSAFVLLL